MKQSSRTANDGCAQAHAVPNAAVYPQPVRIELVTTADDELGPSPLSDDGIWHVVHSADGHTLWRRIRLEP